MEVIDGLARGRAVPVGVDSLLLSLLSISPRISPMLRLGDPRRSLLLGVRFLRTVALTTGVLQIEVVNHSEEIEEVPRSEGVVEGPF